MTREQILNNKCRENIDWYWILDNGEIEKFGRSFQEELCKFFESQRGDLSLQNLRNDRKNNFLVTVRK